MSLFIDHPAPTDRVETLGWVRPDGLNESAGGRPLLIGIPTLPRVTAGREEVFELPFSYKLTPSADQPTTVWSGGTTTELAIFPPGASYSARNFQWRISTAVVTAPESTFTSLPDWHRLLMVLSGQMCLNHSGHHEITLSPFEQDSFSGNWVTQCTGTGRDFNLMMAAGRQGSLQALRLSAGESVAIESAHPEATEAFYCLSGGAEVSLPEDAKLAVDRGDFLLLQRDRGEARPVEVAAGGDPVELIRASVWPE